MSFYVKISLFLVLCSGFGAVVVLKSNQDGISNLTYFCHNSEKTGNFFVNKFTKQTLKLVWTGSNM